MFGDIDPERISSAVIAIFAILLIAAVLLDRTAIHRRGSEYMISLMSGVLIIYSVGAVLYVVTG
jgi:uncharacterized membrane protein YGL010W